MKKGFVFCLGVLAFLFLTLAKPTFAAQYVKVETSLANIYEFLDPKSKILRTAKEGERFEMVFEGTSWYQIKVQDRVGWLEKGAGSVVNTSSGSNAGTVIVIVLLLGATLGGVFYYINKQKGVVEVEA
jgi:hypothetical protein